MPRVKRISDSHPELGLPEVRKLWQTEGLFSDHYLKRRISGGKKIRPSTLTGITRCTNPSKAAIGTRN